MLEAFIITQAIADDLSRLLLGPADAVSRNRVSDLVGALGRSVDRIFLPAGPEDVPHVEGASDESHETITYETRFAQRRAEHRSIADALEAQSSVAADG